MTVSFFRTVEKRRSIRNFSDKPVDKTRIQRILRTALMGPSAKGMQSFRIFVVKNPKKKEELVKATYGQEYVNSSLVLVFCTDPKRIKFMGTRGKKLLSVQDATIAASYAQLAVTALGLSSVWVGHFKEKEVARILKTKLRPVAVIPIGFGNEKPQPKKNQKTRGMIKTV